jgi:Ribonuclease G/E
MLESEKIRRSGMRVAGRKGCRRCRGTGNWDTSGYKVCYSCGGTGTVLKGNAESARLLKLAHVVEVREIIVELEARLAGVVRFGRKQLEADLAERRAQLPVLEAELAVLS